MPLPPEHNALHRVPETSVAGCLIGQAQRESVTHTTSVTACWPWRQLYA